MTKEEAIKIIEEAFKMWKSEFGEGDWKKEDEALSMAISALEKENIYDDKEHYVTISKALYDKLNVDACDDAISREDARMSLTCEIKENMTITDYISMVDKRLRNLPSVTPSKRKGHWIKRNYWKPLPFDVSPLDWDNYDEKTHSEKISHWYCSECGTDYGIAMPTMKFCKECGADMRDIKK